METKLELIFQGKHRVTVVCSPDAASFLKLASGGQLPLESVSDYYEYYGLVKMSQVQVVDSLRAFGWEQTNRYTDGVVKMTNSDNYNMPVDVFVMPDGTCRHPSTHDTRVAQSDLADMGVVFNV